MAGAKLEVKDTGWAEFFRTIREIRDAKVKVGIVGNAAQEKGEGEEYTVAEYGAVNEFGTEDGHVPERSFIRSTFDENVEQYVDLCRDLIGQVVDRRVSLKTALGLLGARAAADVKRKITSNVPPPNAPSTVMQKLGARGRKTARTLGQALGQVGRAASVKTLIDTGRLLNAIGWAVAGPDDTE